MTGPLKSFESEDSNEEPNGPAYRRARFDEPQRRDIGRFLAIIGLLVAVGVVIAGAMYLKSSDSAAKPPITTASRIPTGKICASGNWLKLYDGRPASLESDSGFFLWREPDGWRVRVKGQAAVKTYAIVLTAPQKIDNSTVKTDSPDGGQLSLTGNTATFAVASKPAANGFNFDACTYAEFRVEFRADGNPVPTSVVHVGPDGRALENPLRVKRS